MVQKHIIVSMIAPVAIAGILIMTVLANQAYSKQVSSSVECKITKGGPQECVSETTHERSNTGAKATSAAGATTQQSNNTGAKPTSAAGATTQPSSNAGKAATSSVECKTAPNGSHECVSKPTSAAAPSRNNILVPNTPTSSQQSSNAGNAAQGASNGNAPHKTTNYHITNKFHPGKYHWGPWGHGKFRWHGKWWHTKRCFFGPRGQVRCMYR